MERLGASGFGIFFYMEQRLLPVVAALADRIGLGGLAALVWEIGVVSGLMFLSTSVLGAPVVPAVALAIGVGVFYALRWSISSSVRVRTIWRTSWV